VEWRTRRAQRPEPVGAILAASALMWRSSVPQQPPRTGRPKSSWISHISAYQKVDEWGFPVGRTTRLDTSLRRVVEDGRTVAWDVFFRVNVPGRHYYLNAFGEWENGGGGDDSYTFHVKTRKS
jgi:hypothetical protein